MIEKELVGITSEYFKLNDKCRRCDKINVEILSGGLINCNIKVFNPHDSYKPVVLTIYKENPLIRIEQQRKVFSLAENIPNVPVQKLYNTSVNKEGVGIVEKEYIEGSTVAHFVENGDLSEAKWSNIMYQLGYVLANIHSVPARQVGRFVDNNKQTLNWKDFFMQRFDNRIAKLDKKDPSLQFGKTSIRSVQDMIPYLVDISNKTAPLLGEVDNPALLHHDFHFLNIIMTDEPQVRGILDWENLTGGDPEFDLAFFETQLFLNRQYIPNINRVHEHLIESYVNKVGHWPKSQKRSLYMLDCALSYFEAITNIPAEKITGQVNLYAEGQAEIIRKICQK